MDFIAISLTLATSGADAKTLFPSLEKVTEIRLGFHSEAEWRGRFFTNGVARLAYGKQTLMDAVDMAQAPEGSFHFKDIYNILAPYLKQGQVVDTTNTMAVGFVLGSSGKGFYIEDKEIMRKLMHELRDKTIPLHKSSFENLLSTKPLVPNDNPSQFFYDHDEKDYISMQLAAWAWLLPGELQYGWHMLGPEPPTIEKNWTGEQKNTLNNPESKSMQKSNAGK